MPLRLRPREARFGDRFGELGSRLVTGAHLLAEVVAADQPGRMLLVERVHDADQDAEEAAHAVLRELAAAFVTPFDRVDVYRLAWSMRLASRSIGSVAEQIALFGMGPLPDQVTEQVVLVGRAADVTLDAMPTLGRLRAMGHTWTELTRLGKQSGEVHRRLLAAALAGASDDVTGVHRILRVADGLRESVASFEAVAHVLEQIVVKEG